MKNPNGSLFVAEVGLIADSDSDSARAMRKRGWSRCPFKVASPEGLAFLWMPDTYAILVDDTGGVDTWRIYRIPSACSDDGQDGILKAVGI